MTGLASHGSAVGSHHLHALFELSFVRIAVATRAIKVSPVINHSWFRLKLSGLFMAICTRNRDVPTGQDKMRLLMLRQRERGRLISLQIVATVTCVEIGRACKLGCVAISVAVGTTLELDLEQSVLAFWYMALSALETGVSSLQWIRA